MKRTVMIGVGTLGLLLPACGGDATSSDQTEVATSSALSSTSEPPETPPSTTATPAVTSPATTAGTTVPAGPPVYDPAALGDNLMLPSFTLTVTVDNTNSGQLNETITSTGFVNDPMSVSEVATFSFDSTTDSLRKFLVGGRSYEENQFGDWYLFEAGSSDAPDYTNRLDLRSGTLGSVLSAELAGQEDFEGVPANHFVFDETDLANYSSYSVENPSPTVEGDFFLAQDGNYVLYTHSKETSPNRTYEVTEALSAIGQFPEIVLPEDLTPMREALDIGVDLGSLLPPGAALSSMLRYAHGIGIDYYSYESSVPTNDQFLTFYQTLPPTNGWAVSHIGHIKPHLEPINCETSIECVVLNNGDDQIVVSFGGGITIEYDREHIFSPL